MGKGRAPCCDKSKVKRGPWSPAEDLKLITFIQKNGHDNWRSLPKQAGLLRCGKSCRLRWINYLRPDVKRGNFTQDEEETIFKLHDTFGNKWSKIASHFPGRTDNEIKNVWNTHLKKKKVKKTDDPSGDESKESSIITSSSSSSLTTISCHKKRHSDFVLAEEKYSDPPKRPRNGTPKEEEDEEEENNDEFGFQLEEDPNKEQVMMVSTTTASDSSCGSNISNESSIAIIDQVDDISRLGDHDEVILIDNSLLDYDGPYDEFSDKALEDQELVMSLNNEYGLWDKLDDATLFESNNNQDQLVLHNNNPETTHHTGEIENNKEWFKYLETELGLEPTTMEINTNNNDISSNNKNNLGFDQDYSKIIEELVLPECNFFDIETKTEFSPSSLELFSPSYELLWPSDLPQNSPAI